MILLALIAIVLIAAFVAGIGSVRRGGTGPLVGGVLAIVTSVGAGAWLVANWTP